MTNIIENQSIIFKPDRKNKNISLFKDSLSIEKNIILIM